jgi:uncharacterized protein with FMN-binding domain
MAKKIANGLVAMSSAAVLAVYAAGYVRTRSAADRLEKQTAERRRPAPAAPPELPATPEEPKAVEIAEAKPATLVPKVKEPAVAEAPVEAPAAEAPPPVPAPEPVAAPAPEPPPPPPPPPPKPVWKDGTYTGWGTSRHGDIQAEVIIEGGKIASATIAQCRTRYSCSVIEKLPPEVAQRQSPDVDYVSGATQSADAFYYAVVEALGKAK